MKVYRIGQDCDGFDAIGFILERKLRLFLAARGVVGTIGEMYAEGVRRGKPADAIIVALMLDAILPKPPGIKGRGR